MFNRNYSIADQGCLMYQHNNDNNNDNINNDNDNYDNNNDDNNDSGIL